MPQSKGKQRNPTMNLLFSFDEPFPSLKKQKAQAFHQNSRRPRSPQIPEDMGRDQQRAMQKARRGIRFPPTGFSSGQEKRTGTEAEEAGPSTMLFGSPPPIRSKLTPLPARKGTMSVGLPSRKKGGRGLYLGPSKKSDHFGARWLMPVIPGLWEAKTLLSRDGEGGPGKVTWKLLSGIICELVGGLEHRRVAEITRNPIIHLRKWLHGFGTRAIAESSKKRNITEIPKLVVRRSQISKLYMQASLEFSEIFVEEPWEKSERLLGTQMKLETIIHSKLTQEQKTKHHMFSLISGSGTMRTQGHRKGNITHLGLSGGGGTLNGATIFLKEDHMRKLEQREEFSAQSHLGSLLVEAQELNPGSLTPELKLLAIRKALKACGHPHMGMKPLNKAQLCRFKAPG
ncbi:hypothetical protein AAY473_035182 [Plecturocebus cupreus]